ncbi:MAG: peptidoglycan DD-metalloendopeptidase family protein [Paralcaligenes sp.]
MPRLPGAVLLAFCAIWPAAVYAADSTATLAAKQTQARKQQAELQARIGKVQKEIDSQESSRRDAADELKTSESAISSINRRLDELARQKHDAQTDLTDIATQQVRQKQLLVQRQGELADQLRAQYASGLSPWTALLSGNDPQIIGRELGYLGYVSEARTKTVKAIRSVIDQLAQLQARSEARNKELDAVAHEVQAQKKSLEEQKRERQQILAKIESQLKVQRTQAQTLEHNDQRLGKLITGLDAAIAQQREAERLAQEQRRAEAERRAEKARREALERKREIQRQQEAARQAQDKAQNQQDERDAKMAREQVEQARAKARVAEQAAREADKAKPATAKQAPEAQSAQARSAGGGLKKGLRFPVQGEVQGRFGMGRPDGGLWRGIVLRAAAGTPVHVVADGRVVYANWLSGFGNIMIVDHGDKYLSIYAYNQSLLKRVGDIVHAGETIATVGSSGGQVESGLYFEIRHQGTPVNPLLWLGH